MQTESRTVADTSDDVEVLIDELEAGGRLLSEAKAIEYYFHFEKAEGWRAARKELEAEGIYWEGMRQGPNAREPHFTRLAKKDQPLTLEQIKADEKRLAQIEKTHDALYTEVRIVPRDSWDRIPPCLRDGETIRVRQIFGEPDENGLRPFLGKGTRIGKNTRHEILDGKEFRCWHLD